jgi:hypothetical protein
MQPSPSFSTHMQKHQSKRPGATFRLHLCRRAVAMIKWCYFSRHPLQKTAKTSTFTLSGHAGSQVADMDCLRLILAVGYTLPPSQLRHISFSLPSTTNDSAVSGLYQPITFST